MLIVACPSGQYSIRALQAEMKKQGLRTESGKALSKGCIEKMLANPFYTGVIRIRRTGATYAGAHEPLLSANIFKTVQAIKEGRYAKKVTRHNHTYRGLFQCRQCGLSMIPERQKGHVYYRCQKQGCPTNSIREERLEDAVAAFFDQSELSDAVIQTIIDTAKAWFAESPHTDNIRSCQLQLDQVTGCLDRLTDALLDQAIDRDTFNRRREKLLLEQADLEQKLIRLRQERVSPTMLQAFLERIKNLRDHYIFADPTEKRALVQSVLSNRQVSAKKVYLEPSNWLDEAKAAVCAFSCADILTFARTHFEERP